MEQHKVLQPYKDWLLLNRGEIRPEVGDKILLFHGYSYWQDLKVKRVKYNNSVNHIELNDDEIYDINKCYVEIDYNPNESIEFGQFILDRDKNHFSVQELYKQFKNE